VSAAAGTVTGMDELCDDLLLLAVRPDGTLALPAHLRFGVSGAELVRLAAARRVDIERGRIVVLDTTPTGDELLDAALASMAGGRRGPSAKAWVARHRPGLVHLYLARAAAAGTISEERGTRLGFIPVTRWLVTDTARAAAARARLEAVAAGTGPVGQEQAALAGLSAASGVALVAFPGRAGSAARKRLREAGKRDPASRRRPAPRQRPRTTRQRPPPTRPPRQPWTRPPGRRWTRPSGPPPTRRSTRRSPPPPTPPCPPPPTRRTARPTTAAPWAVTTKPVRPKGTSAAARVHDREGLIALSRH
jgi:hypothetical protein